MKKITLMILIAIIATMGACSSSKKGSAASNQTAMTTTREITNKRWQLIEIRGNKVAESINGKMPFIEFSKTDNRYSASAGCNGIGGEYTLEGTGKITFSKGMSTLMACPDMEVEEQLAKVLEIADNYTINNDILSLNKARMTPLARFKEAASPSLNGTWEVDYIGAGAEGFDKLFPNRTPTLSFNLSENKATGNSGCNSFNVAFTTDKNNIKFDMPASTRMACPGNGEATFFSALQKISAYSISDNTLNLIMGDIAIMRLQRK